jgi:hypothetical protein
MMEETNFDPDTGEMFPETISNKAIDAARRALEVEEAELLGLEKLKLDAALMAAVIELPAWITTDRVNPAYKSKYASLKAILETVRPILHKHGVRIRQGTLKSWPLDEGGGVKGRLVPVFTDLVHTESGEVQRTEVEMPLSRMDPGAMSSAISYGQRKTLLMGLGLTTDEADDDGESAKLNKITDEHKDSALLSALTLEMKKNKDPSKLYEWGDDANSKRRFSQLDEGELAIMRQRFSEYGKSLLSSDEEPIPAKGQKK